MRDFIILLLIATYVSADNNLQRRKVPFVVDAVGNALPPPSKVPAAVGSPVNLLTPDRYEFYTFDESGELVKRLMTLEEIQEIVAAGEESEGLVTFANNNQPTIAFNFTQPSSTKVHSVVTNVQNVLREQMEAHKNQPQLHPTFDTPDVSQSWSLILPSIFGNTGVDIIPDKNAESYPTPDTDMLEINEKTHQTEKNNIFETEDISKEGDNNLSLISKTTFTDEILKSTTVTEKMPSTILSLISPTSSLTTTTTTTTTKKPNTTIKTTTFKLINATQSTSKQPTKSTTLKPTRTLPTIKATTKAPTVISTSTYKISNSTKYLTTPGTPTIKPVTSTISAIIGPELLLSSHTSTPFAVPYTIPNLKNYTKNLTSTTIKPTSTISDKQSSVTLKTTKPIITTEKVNNKLTVKNDPIEVLLNFTTKKPVIEQNIKTRKPIPAIPNIFESEKSSTVDFQEITTTKVDTSTKSTITSTSSSLNTKTTTQTRTISKTTPFIYEKVSTFLPTSLYATKETKIPENSTNPTFSSANQINKDFKTTSKVFIPVTTPVSPTLAPTVNDGENFPSTTEYIKVVNSELLPSSTTSTENTSNKQILSFTTEETSTTFAGDNPILTLFDVAQSISQIASDLGGEYTPIPSTIISLLDSPKPTDFNLESKENLEIDILSDNKNETLDKFIKISTIDPHKNINQNQSAIPEPVGSINKFTEPFNEIQPKEHVIDIKTVLPVKTTTVNSILTEATVDLSQVVKNDTQSFTLIEKNTEKDVINDTIDMETKNLLQSPSIKLDLNEKSSLISLPENVSSDKPVPVSNGTKSINSELNKVHLKIESEVNKSDNLSLSTRSESEKMQPVLTFYGANYNSLMNEAYKPSNLTDSLKHENDSGLQSKVNYVVRESSTQRNVDIDDDIIVNKDITKVEEFKRKIQKVNIDDKEFENERNNSWKIISTISPPNAIQEIKVEAHDVSINEHKNINLEFSKENQGLEVSTKDLGDDIIQFTELCNELAFRYWSTIVEKIDKRRSFIMSPYSITSMLAMMFMGARGATSGEMNEILKLDDMVTFNPHFTLKNISDSIEISAEAGVAVSAFIRELYSDRNKGKILTFYKERAQHFYNGHVEEVNFKLISDIIRRRTNLLVKRYTWNKIQEYMKSNSITMQPPLAAFSTNIFQTDCTGTSVEGRDGEMYFVVSPNVRQRRLVPVPAVVYKKGFLAGYDPVLDATAAALGNVNSIVSVLFLMPGQQGNVVHTQDLEELERRLLDTNPTTPNWNRLLRTLLPRIGLELQIPRFSHKSIFNVSSSLKMMGLKDLFDAEHADLGGLNGPSKDLYLSDMVQSSTFVTCGESVVGDQHHTEEYPDNIEVTRRRRTLRWTNGWDEPRDYQRAFHDPHDVGDAMNLPLHLRPRQARLPARDAQVARLKFDRPFLYFVRHNPSGMILYVGRYNPRLLP